MFCENFYQLLCEQNESFREEIDRSWNIIDYNIAPNVTYKNDEFEDLDVILTINSTDQVKYFNF